MISFWFDILQIPGRLSLNMLLSVIVRRSVEPKRAEAQQTGSMMAYFKTTIPIQEANLVKVVNEAPAAVPAPVVNPAVVTPASRTVITVTTTTTTIRVETTTHSAGVSGAVAHSFHIASETFAPE